MNWNWAIFLDELRRNCGPVLCVAGVVLAVSSFLFAITALKEALLRAWQLDVRHIRSRRHRCSRIVRLLWPVLVLALIHLAGLGWCRETGVHEIPLLVNIPGALSGGLGIWMFLRILAEWLGVKRDIRRAVSS
ncbi:hypothetical protein [Sutterella sp.]|uniref:hypothetical protein n=1 Tax=Sutterella sp. TaxID=1981025 RepID=UPI0026E0D373|nr:hypothetical protein [Sutterella sp.]MDO5532993.1 hypothetical protein [Sutterella sp.]